LTGGGFILLAAAEAIGTYYERPACAHGLGLAQ
jgi:hypothetical protein